MTVIELVGAAAVLSVLLVVSVQMLGRMVVQQRSVANRRAAVQMAANAMQRAAALSWEELDAPATEAIAQAVTDQKMLRGAEVRIAVDTASEAMPRSKRVRVTVAWTEGGDGVGRTQHLTAWRFPATSTDVGGEPPEGGRP